jgi:hypothetical protein
MKAHTQRGNNLDTLAQPPQATPTKGCSAQALTKKARRKYFTQGFVKPLLELDSPLHKQYQRAHDCANAVRVEEGRTRTHYCNSRVCNVCNGIRTAKAMKGYMTHFEGRESVFITLTDVTCGADELRSVMLKRVRKWNNIRDYLQRRMGLPIQGITKRECTFSIRVDRNGLFHPHLHILLMCEGHDLSALAELIVQEWLKRNPTANRKAQDYRPTDQNSLNEIFKYTTKQANREGKTLKVDPEALDVIMNALHKTRTFQPFGGLRKITEEVEEVELIAQEVNVPDGLYVWNSHDWYSIDTGQALSGYVSPMIHFDVQHTNVLVT